MIALSSDVSVPAAALSTQFVHASGPGGQHVNKVATAVELRLHVGTSGLPPAVQQRLRQLAGSRLNRSDEIVLFAQQSRSQLRNRADAFERLAQLIRNARVAPKRRRPTQPSQAARRARRDAKRRRGALKRDRTRPSID